MALLYQIDFPAFFSLRKMTPEFHQFRNTTVRYRLCPLRWPYAAMFRKLTSGIDRLRKVNLSVTESIVDC
jgi:hypothetical protein